MAKTIAFGIVLVALYVFIVPAYVNGNEVASANNKDNFWSIFNIFPPKKPKGVENKETTAIADVKTTVKMMATKKPESRKDNNFLKKSTESKKEKIRNTNKMNSLVVDKKNEDIDPRKMVSSKIKSPEKSRKTPTLNPKVIKKKHSIGKNKVDKNSVRKLKNPRNYEPKTRSNKSNYPVTYISKPLPERVYKKNSGPFYKTVVQV